MTWDLPYRWGGPVLAWELRRLGRLRWPWFLYFFFLAFCVAQLFVLYSRFATRLEAQKQAGRQFPGMSRTDADIQAKLDFASRHVGRFFPQQLLFLLFITPAVTASALGHEKEKDTLTALFTTELADKEIVVGKVLGRLWILVKFMLISMPVIFSVAGFAGVDFLPLVLCYVHALVMTFALVGICMLGSVITRRTRDGVMACYSMIVILILGTMTVTGDLPIPLWLNPVEVVVRISTPPFTGINPLTLLLHLGIFLALGWLFVRLSRHLIRRMALRQLEDRSSRWKWSIRGEVGEDSIRWRERHILGLAPLQALRSMPTWLGWAGVFAFAVSFVLGLMNAATHGRITYHFLRGDWGITIQNMMNINPTTITGDVALMGVMLIIFAGVTVLFRCAGAVTEEKRRKTWDDLVMTGLSVDEIVRSKTWGIVQAAMPYLFLYAIPMFVYAGFHGPALLVGLITLGIAVVVTLVGAALGAGFALSGRDRHEVNRSYRHLEFATLEERRRLYGLDANS
jgi:ABC-type transport system involved in multi-copper enzyme maturation permease subunit